MKIQLSHSLEDVMSSFDMSFEVRGGNKKVIYVDNKPSFSNCVTELVVHELLECDRGVAKAKEHDY